MIIKKIFSTAISVVLAVAFAFPAAAFADDSNGISTGESVPELSLTYVEDETDVASEEEIAYALENGVEGMSAVDSVDDTLDASSTLALNGITTNSARDIKVYSYSGNTRYDTAVAIAHSAYPSGVSSKTAIICRGDDNGWADSLSASSLAGFIDCPVLFTSTEELPSATASALSDLNVSSVIIIGGTSSVSDDVESALQASGFTTTRLGGSTRYDTQMKIYDYGNSIGTWSTTAIVASGSAYADALSASPIAFSQHMPIFLAQQDGSLTTDQLVALMNSDTTQFKIIGGTSVLASTLDGYLAGVAAHNAGYDSADSVERLSGSDRYVTSWQVALWSVNSGYLNWDGTAFANGSKAADALVGSVLQGKTPAPVLLMTNDDFSTVYTLANYYKPSYVRVFGGTAVISQISRNYIADAFGYGLSQIQGFKVYVDAGHGYNNTGNGVYDSGAVGCGYQEATLTKELADMVAAQLVADGYDVFLNDDGGPYKYRHGEAIAQDCNVIISIHFNATGTGRGSGTMSLIHDSNACALSSGVQNILHPYVVSGTGLSDLGKRTQEVSILSGSLPATLLEICFIDNSYDMGVYQARKSTIADQIVLGIEAI